MRKVKIPTFILLLNLIFALVLYVINDISIVALSIYVIISMVVIGWAIMKTDGNRITYTTALLLYTCATQFGLVIPYAFFGRHVLSDYSDWTLAFLDSEFLSRAVILGVIGCLSLVIGTHFSRAKYSNYLFSVDETEDSVAVEKKTYIVGILSLLTVLLFFLYNILSGGMRLFTTYESFRQSSAYNSSIYSYILILFYVGTIYLASSGKIKEHIPGWIIWLILVLIFALNGNKGEFLYALLAVIGMQGVEGKKISWKMFLLGMAIVFFIIPGITSLRNIGILGNLSSADINFADAFIEMGMQIRTSVYSMRDLADGSINHLLGKSYYQPIINILTPFLRHTQATAEIRKMYPGFGYNQVIESYVNFGILGTMAFFFIVGYFLGKSEAIVNNKLKLAYIGTITCILINATRNYFAFVPGQIIIVSMIYYFLTRVRLQRSYQL